MGDAYTRVEIEGVLLLDRAVFVQAVTVLGPGWWVMTPLKTVRRPRVDQSWFRAE